MHLRDAIGRILAPRPSAADTTPFIDLSLTIASVYLGRRIRAGTLDPSFFSLTTDDLALDCIAPLFERDATGCFVQLRTYYAAHTPASLSDADLLAATRRLVFSSVHQQLVRLYRDHDPSLEKIIRNLRNAVKGGIHLVEDRRGGELWLASVTETALHRGLPEMPWVYLEGELTGSLQERTPLSAVVREVAVILTEQNVYRRSVPLTALALILRMAYSRMGGAGVEALTAEGPVVRPEEAERLIADALAGISREKRKTYVGRGKVTEEVYDAYMAAVGAILHAEFVENDGHDLSYCAQMQTFLPGLGPGEYRNEHRCHLEYLAKITRERFLSEMRNELGGSAGGNGS